MERNVNEYRHNNEACPRCGSVYYTDLTDPEKPNCLICAYNIVRDNPNTFPNKLRKIFGMYNDRKLSWEEMERFLIL